MSEFFSVLIPAVLGAASGAMGAYVAIKSDLSELRARVVNVEHSANRAHERIDNGGASGRASSRH